MLVEPAATILSNNKAQPNTTTCKSGPAQEPRKGQERLPPGVSAPGLRGGGSYYCRPQAGGGFPFSSSQVLLPRTTQ